MKRVIFMLSLLALSACSGPQNRTQNAASAGVATPEWPELSGWEKGTDRSGDVAVIVAIEDYAFLPDVSGAVRNANDWEAYFRAQGAEEVLVLTNDNAPREDILDFAKRGASAVKPGGKLWFLFIGHGAPAADGKDGVLVGMDARQTPESLSSRGVKRGEVLAALEGPQEETIVLLDACFSGRSGDGETLAPGAQPVVPISPTIQAADKAVIISAAKGDQFAGALPMGLRPAFSYLMLGALRGWADDGDGNVTAGEATLWVEKQMRHIAGRQQTPEIGGDASLTLASATLESDPGIAEMMRGERVYANTDDGIPRFDTGAGVAVVQPEGFDPASFDRNMGQLVAYREESTGAFINVMAFRASKAEGDEAIKTHQKLMQKTERPIRFQQSVTYGGVTYLESEFEQTVDSGLVIRSFLFERATDDSLYRILALTPVHSRDEHYVAFQSFMEGMRFVAARDRLPTINEARAAMDADADEPKNEAAANPQPQLKSSIGIEAPPSPWTRNSAAETGTMKVVFAHPDGSSIMIGEEVHADGNTAVTQALASQDATVKQDKVIDGPRPLNYGDNRGSYMLVQPSSEERARLAVWTKVDKSTVWQFILVAHESKVSTHVRTWGDVIKKVEFK